MKMVLKAINSHMMKIEIFIQIYKRVVEKNR
jgi:hypothetical protein